MDLHPPGQKIRTGLVSRLFDDGEDAARGTHDGFLPGHEPADHFRRTWLVVLLGDRGQIRKITIRTGRPMPKRANTLGNLIDREGQLRLMRFEQYV